MIIKAQRYRSQERIRADALVRLLALVYDAATVRVPRRATKPTKGSLRRRVDSKVRRGLVMAARGKVVE